MNKINALPIYRRWTFSNYNSILLNNSKIHEAFSERDVVKLKRATCLIRLEEPSRRVCGALIKKKRQLEQQLSRVNSRLLKMNESFEKKYGRTPSIDGLKVIEKINHE